MPVAVILADSVNAATQDRITTFLLPQFPKCLQAELRTHRSTSQSHYSSRAIPVKKTIEQVLNDPFIPQWTEFRPGMSGADTLTDVTKSLMTTTWLIGRNASIVVANELNQLGAAKQEVNRVLEPYMKGSCIVTATGDAWQGFFELRTAEGVQPDFRTIAQAMLRLYNSNQPQLLQPGNWHIPWVDRYVDLMSQLKISAARSARTSYMNHDGDFRMEKDFKLHDRLLEEKHMTPFEHQAVAVHNLHNCRARNFKGWRHYRQHIEEGRTI
jgi:thymidylate synthase ThyX